MVLLLRYLSFALAASWPLSLAADTADRATLAIEEVQAKQQERPRFPATMRAIGVREGRVSLVVSVDEQGLVQDVLVASASRRAFAESALKSVRSWTFEPARYNGVPFPSSARFDIDFELGRNLKWQTFSAPVETNITQSGKMESPVTARSLRELDSIPMPLSLVEPLNPVDGRATIEFYIDELGNARCPRLLDGDNLDFARETIAAISQWKFQPPIAAGLRTNAVVRQTFHYSDGRFGTSRPQ